MKEHNKIQQFIQGLRLIIVQRSMSGMCFFHTME